MKAHPTRPLHLLLGVTAWAAAAAAQAMPLDDAGKIDLTGFYQLTTAKVLSGSANDGAGGTTRQWQYMDWKCPCTIQNWEYVGVYEKHKGFQFDQESLVGAQLRAEITPALSATAQVLVRPTGADGQSYVPSVDWAYLSLKVSEDWSLQAGRKRIPLYYYSDYLYIGYAYPWVRPAPDVYGWPIYAYDGVTAQYSSTLGNSDWTANGALWWGSFTDNKNQYYERIYYAPRIKESWKDITGGWLGVSNGVIDARLLVMGHRESTSQTTGGTTTVINDQVFTRILGASFNVDYQQWLLRTELNRFAQRPKDPTKYVYNYYLVGVGYKVGAFTPMLTKSSYMTEANTLAPQEGRSTVAASLRWDFRTGMALKAQLDSSKDRSKYSYPFFGDSKLLSISLQGTF